MTNTRETGSSPAILYRCNVTSSRDFTCPEKFKMKNKGNAVGLAVVPVIVVTAIWVIVGGIVPLFIKGPNKR